MATSIQNNALEALTARAAPHVLQAIKQASAKTGVNFAYMVKQAAAESSFNPVAKAKTSSAAGLYQFIESTWLDIVGKHGAKHGIETQGKSRAEILALREDPKAASFMAAAFASENEKFLNSHWGGDVGETELYFAHFMGAGGAAAFLRARDENPLETAADLFPKAAQANRNVFYDPKTGRARSLEEVYAFFDKKFSADPVKAPPPAQRPESNVFVARNLPSTSNTALYRSAPQPQNTLNSIPFQRLVHSPVEIMLLAQLDPPGVKNGTKTDAHNSLF